jgi:hypothetical protein
VAERKSEKAKERKSERAKERKSKRAESHLKARINSDKLDFGALAPRDEDGGRPNKL